MDSLQKSVGEVLQKHEALIRVLISILTAALFLVLFVLFGKCQYETNDDEMMNLISAGAYGAQYSQYLVYSNVIYGLILKLLFFIVPTINWYLGLMLFFNMIAFAALSVAFGKYFSLQGHLLVSVLVNVILGSQFYNALGFTRNAALYAIAGFILWITYSSSEDRKDFVYVWWGISLIVLATLVRKQCLFFIAPYALITVLGICYRQSQIVVKINQIIITIALLIAVLVIDYGVYHFGAGWTDYNDSLSALTNILDYGREIDYSEDMVNASIKPSEIEMLKRWDWMDSNTFSVDRLKSIAYAKSMQEPRTISVKHVWYTILETNMSWILAWFISMALALLLSKSWRITAIELLFGILILGYYYYFARIGRVVERVTSSVWFAASLFTICAGMKLTKEMFVLSRSSIIITLMILAICIGKQYKYYDQIKGRQYVVNVESNSELFAEMNRNKDNVYLLDTKSLIGPKEDNLVVLDKRYQDYCSNMVLLGGWYAYSPANRSNYQKYGITNPIRDLLSVDNCYFVAGEEATSCLTTYYSEVYGVDISVELIQEINQIGIWKIEEQ